LGGDGIPLELLSHPTKRKSEYSGQELWLNDNLQGVRGKYEKHQREEKRHTFSGWGAILDH